MPAIFQSLIQSNLSGGDHSNFEAVIVEGDSLVHWWRDNDAVGTPWKRAQIIVPSGVAGAGALILSDFMDSDENSNFEVVVPLWGSTGLIELWHFFRENSDASTPWVRVQRVTGDGDEVAGPASLIQSDFGSDEHGNFELVVPLVNSSRRVELWHFFHDNSDTSTPWQRVQRITSDIDDVAGPACLIQSDLGGNDHDNFEVVVPLWGQSAAMELWHFFHDNSDSSNPWQRVQRIADNVSGPGVLIQSDFLSDEHGNFEVLVPEGRRLAHYFRENADTSVPWQRAGGFVTDSLAGWASLIQSDFGDDDKFPYFDFVHKNFEILVEECDGSVIAYFHSNADSSLPWLRHQVLIPRKVQQRLPDTRKIVQLTGEFDAQGWNGLGTPPFAHNRTETRFRIRGTDLGSSFVHKAQNWFLFGDTWRIDQPDEEENFDCIAFTTDTNPDDGLDLVFLERPPFIHPGVPQGGLNVPLDGVSADDRMFVFFTTDSYLVEGRDQMGRSIVTRSSNDGFDFDQLYEFSRSKFINVTIERLALEQQEADKVGAGRDVLCVWGSGRYRSSDVYLVILPFAELATGNGRRYYAGWGGKHDWSSDERDATPLFCSGDVGELSVRWNPFLGRFLLMKNGDNPRGIVLHAARKPWGPWTRQPIMVFDPAHRAPGLDPIDPCLGDGFGKFMHVPWNIKTCDHLHDEMFKKPRHDDWGGEYGPYQIANMAKGTANVDTQLYFVMSTWNPYQVLLMTTRLSMEVVKTVEQD